MLMKNITNDRVGNVTSSTDAIDHVDCNVNIKNILGDWFLGMG